MLRGHRVVFGLGLTLAAGALLLTAWYLRGAHQSRAWVTLAVALFGSAQAWMARPALTSGR